MVDPTDEDQARNRWMVMNATRLLGVAMVLLGILSLRGVGIDLPEWGGYACIAIGLIDVFVIPQVLARKWRSPDA